MSPSVDTQLKPFSSHKQDAVFNFAFYVIFHICIVWICKSLFVRMFATNMVDLCGDGIWPLDLKFHQSAILGR